MAVLAMVAACAQTPPPAPPPPALSTAGLEKVLGQKATGLIALFGNADLDVREGRARKLQFVGQVCVLDTYLYPPQAGGEPVVTYVDARTPTGDDFDRASCVAELARRSGGR